MKISRLAPNLSILIWSFVLLVFPLALSAQQSGDTDPSFGDRGIVLLPSAYNVEYAHQDNDGSLMVVISSVSESRGSWTSINRYNPDGVLQSECDLPMMGRALGLRNRHLLLASTRVVYKHPINDRGSNDNVDIVIKRFDSNCDVDRSFGGAMNEVVLHLHSDSDDDGEVIDELSTSHSIVRYGQWRDSIQELMEAPDGKILFLGEASGGGVDPRDVGNHELLWELQDRFRSMKRFFAGRLLPDGRWDRGFGDDGRLLLDVPETLYQLSTRPVSAKIHIDVQSNGKVLISAGAGLLRLTTGGRVDDSFRESPGLGGWLELPVDQDGNTIKVASDDKIVISGRERDPRHRLAVMRLESDGRPDPAFGFMGMTVMDTELDEIGASTIQITPSRILVCGTGYDPSTRNELFLFRDDILFVSRFMPDGSPDESFGGGRGFANRRAGPPLLHRIEPELGDSDHTTHFHFHPICVSPPSFPRRIIVAGRYLLDVIREGPINEGGISLDESSYGPGRVSWSTDGVILWGLRGLRPGPAPEVNLPSTAEKINTPFQWLLRKLWKRK